MTIKLTNPFEYREDPELNIIFDKMVQLKTRVDATIAKATSVGDIDASQGFVKLNPCKITLLNYKNRRTASTWAKTNLDVIDREVKESIAAAEKTIDEVAALNNPLVENNTKVAAKIKDLMVSLGIPTSYTTYEYATARSRTRTSKTHQAGYIGDLTRAIPVNEVETARYTLKTYIEEYSRWKKAEEDAELKEKIERDDQAFSKYVLNNPTLVENLMRAGVNILSVTQNATTGNKLELVKYSIAQAIVNLEAMPEPDEDLIEALRNAI